MADQNTTQEPQPITWDELKTFVNSLSEEQLKNKIPVLFQDETAARYLLEPFKMENDIYIYDNDGEDCGTLEELREIREAEEMKFDLEDCTLVTPKGTPFLWLE
ncbi:hypothetical protein [Elizabethkingia phage TCUEAP2]|nr:hypothetical protein [Elizabethkingia phage TCUEAP2]